MCLNIFLFVRQYKCCIGRESSGFGVCLDEWKWKCPYEKKCIEVWKVCDGWADCTTGKDEVSNIFLFYVLFLIKIYIYIYIYIVISRKTNSFLCLVRLVERAGKKSKNTVNLRNGDG